jgi:hypothetical protein
MLMNLMSTVFGVRNYFLEISALLRGLGWWSVTDVSVQPISSIHLAREDETDRLPQLPNYDA